MKKISFILLVSFLLCGVGKEIFTNFFIYRKPSIVIIPQVVFVNMIRDLELLNSWLLNTYDNQKGMDIICYQTYKKILALYNVDQKIFKENVKYYLQDSSKRALKVYEEVFFDLKSLIKE